jgi:hypothetical protein
MAHKAEVLRGQTHCSWQDFVSSANLICNVIYGFARDPFTFESYPLEITETHRIARGNLVAHFALPRGQYINETVVEPPRTHNMAMWQTYESGVDLLRIIDGVITLLATEPRDKAYAMLWAFLEHDERKDTLKPLFQVDYRKPIHTVFTEFTSALMHTSQMKTYPLYVTHSWKERSSLPSWVPDWSFGVGKENMLRWTPQILDEGYRASGADTSLYHFEIFGMHLHMFGHRMNRIRTIFQFPGREEGKFEFNKPETFTKAFIPVLRTLRAFFQTLTDDATVGRFLEDLYKVSYMYVEGSANRYYSIQEYKPSELEKELTSRLKISLGLLRTRFLRDILCIDIEGAVPDVIIGGISDILTNYVSQSDRERLIDWLQAGMRSLENKSGNVTELFKDGFGILHEIIRETRSWIQAYDIVGMLVVDHLSKTLFITENGQLGLAFHGIAPEDTVVLWQGCPTPMVARCINHGGLLHWKYLGCCFVDGLMMGEGWPSSDGNLEEFILC